MTKWLTKENRIVVMSHERSGSNFLSEALRLNFEADYYSKTHDNYDPSWNLENLSAAIRV